MSQSLAKVIVHLVFSTKHRQPWIDSMIQGELHAYLAGVAKNHDCQPHCIGGVEDHVHIGCSLSRSVSIADLVRELKVSSSKWIKSQGERHRSFSWQSGYGAFSIGHSQLEDLRSYIAKQREHHARVSSQDEYRRLLSRYGIEFDERYVWD